MINDLMFIFYLAACWLYCINAVNISCCFDCQTIPTELAKKYNLDEKNLIVLRDPRGTSWSVTLSSWQDGRRCLSSGWSHLYKKNRLKEGDVCVLEFVQGGAAINVHIFRAEEYNAKKIPKPRKELFHLLIFHPFS